MPRLLILIAVVLLACGAWFMLRSPSAEQSTSAARLSEAGAIAPAAPSELAAVPEAAAAATRAAAPAAPRTSVDRQSVLERNGLLLVCAATTKGVPRFRLRLLAGTESIELVTDLDGWIELPGWARSGTLRVLVRSKVWGFRTALLSLGEGAEPADSIEVEMGAAGALQIDWIGPNFLLVDVPGAQFHDGYAPYGDFGHREVLEDDLLLCVEVPKTWTPGNGPSEKFELRGNYEQWIAHGTVEREGDRILAERVSVQRVALSRLDVSLQHEDGSGFRSPAQIVLLDPATGEEWTDEVEGERGVFRGRPPGAYTVLGSARGILFGPQEVELIPFQKGRVDLRGRAGLLSDRALDVELIARLGRSAVMDQLPSQLTLQPRESSSSGWSGNDTGKRLSAEERLALNRTGRVHWVGTGREWSRRVHFDEVPVGRYSMRLNGTLPAPDLLRRALREADLDQPAKLERSVPSPSIAGLREPVWIYRDLETSRVVALTVPDLVRVDLTWDAANEAHSTAAKRVHELLGVPEPIGVDWGDGVARFLFAGEPRVPGRVGTTVLLSHVTPRRIEVGISMVGEERNIEPGHLALQLELGESQVETAALGSFPTVR